MHDEQRRHLTARQIEIAVRQLLWPRSRLAGFRRLTKSGSGIERTEERKARAAIYMFAGHPPAAPSVH